jgi:hypothetical protein
MLGTTVAVRLLIGDKKADEATLSVGEKPPLLAP